MKKTEDFLATVTRPYNSWSDPKLATETVTINAAMTDNTWFPTPDPEMSVYNAAVSDYNVCLAKAASRDMDAVAAKNASRNTLISLTIQLGTYADLTAMGNVEALTSTRLPLRKKAQTVVLQPPQNFRISNGINPGELVLKTGAVKGASIYYFEYTAEPLTEVSTWGQVSCTTSRFVIKGLEKGTQYWFKVSVVGRNGQLVVGQTILSPYVQ